MQTAVRAAAWTPPPQHSQRPPPPPPPPISVVQVALGLWEQKCPEEKVESCDTWLRILPVGTDLLAGPQKIWLAISFPLLLPCKLTACHGRSTLGVTALHYTAVPGITVSLFSYRCTQSAFPRLMGNPLHRYTYHSSICTGHDGLAVYNNS